jgi:hypothetical protein
MVQGDIVKRSWSKNSQISEHTDILDIWDTGSHIYERWPNGNEMYWKIISRELTETGFIELLEKMPTWQMPANVIRSEQIPLQQCSVSEFQLGSWKVEQVIEKPCDTNVLLDVQRKHNTAHQKPYNKSKRHSMGQVHVKIKDRK